MMPHDFPEYAALWREQIDPKELAGLQAMATKIKRSAGRRLLLDRLLGLLAVGMTSFVLLRDPAPPLLKLSLALLLLVPIWCVWKRHQITRASRAIAVDDPRLFFDAAIENVRAEINWATLSAWLGIPLFFAAVVLAGAGRGVDHIYMSFRDLFTLGSVKAIAIAIIMIVAFVLIIRDNIKFRAQLRRLEAMHREWDERDPGDGS